MTLSNYWPLCLKVWRYYKVVGFLKSWSKCACIDSCVNTFWLVVGSDISRTSLCGLVGHHCSVWSRWSIVNVIISVVTSAMLSTKGDWLCISLFMYHVDILEKPVSTNVFVFALWPFFLWQLLFLILFDSILCWFTYKLI